MSFWMLFLWSLEVYIYAIWFWRLWWIKVQYLQAKNLVNLEQTKLKKIRVGESLELVSRWGVSLAIDWEFRRQLTHSIGEGNSQILAVHLVYWTSQRTRVWSSLACLTLYWSNMCDGVSLVYFLYKWVTWKLARTSSPRLVWRLETHVDGFISFFLFFFFGFNSLINVVYENLLSETRLFQLKGNCLRTLIVRFSPQFFL